MQPVRAQQVRSCAHAASADLFAIARLLPVHARRRNHDLLRMLEGELEQRGFSMHFVHGTRLHGICCLNASPHRAARRACPRRAWAPRRLRSARFVTLVTREQVAYRLAPHGESCVQTCARNGLGAALRDATRRISLPRARCVRTAHTMATRRNRHAPTATPLSPTRAGRPTESRAPLPPLAAGALLLSVS